MDAAATHARLGAAYAEAAAAARHERVVLWFEHDVFDQLALIRLLDVLPPLDGRLFAVTADGIRHFGRMDAAALAALRGSERPVAPALVAEAQRAWRAVSAFEDPRPLDALRRERLGWPHLVPALARLLEELPDTRDGLARSERVALAAIAGGAADLAALMRAAHAADPVLAISDAALTATVAALAEGALRLVEGTDGAWRATARGLAVLAGTEICRPRPRWVGGTSVRSPPAWLWDAAAGQPVAGARPLARPGTAR